MMVTALGKMVSYGGNALLGRAGRSFLGSGMVRILSSDALLSLKV